MNSTFVANQKTPTGNHLAYSYTGDHLKSELIPYTSCEQIVGDGGIYSNIDDMKNWLMSLQNSSLISEDRINNLIFKSGQTKNGVDINYGYGWFIDSSDGAKVIHHGGSWLGYHHSLVYWPEKQIWTLVLSNHTDYGPPARDQISYDLFEFSR